MPNPKGNKLKKRVELTPERLEKFLVNLAKNGGMVSHAAKDCRLSRTALYEKRKEDPEFAAKWNEAHQLGIEVLEDEAKHRALKGVSEPIYYEGEVVGFVRKPSDTLMRLILQAYNPKYREKHEITGADGGPIATSATVVFLPDNKRDKPIPKGDKKQ
jgi:hypothetical protein